MNKAQKASSLFSGNRSGENHSSAHTARCVSDYIFLIKKKQEGKKKRKEKEKKKKEPKKKRKYENLTGYDGIVCEFALCTFNLLDRVLNFSWLFISI